MNDALHTDLIKLRLSGLAQALDVRLQEAAGNHLQHAGIWGHRNLGNLGTSMKRCLSSESVETGAERLLEATRWTDAH